RDSSVGPARSRGATPVNSGSPRPSSRPSTSAAISLALTAPVVCSGLLTGALLAKSSQHAVRHVQRAVRRDVCVRCRIEEHREAPFLPHRADRLLDPLHYRSKQLILLLRRVLLHLGRALLQPLRLRLELLLTLRARLLGETRRLLPVLHLERAQGVLECAQLLIERRQLGAQPLLDFLRAGRLLEDPLRVDVANPHGL